MATQTFSQSGLWRLRQEPPELMCQPLNTLVFKKYFFVHFALCHSNCNLSPAQVHILLNPPAASMGSFHVCGNDFTSYWHSDSRSVFVTSADELVVSQIKSVRTLALHNYVTKKEKSLYSSGIYYCFLLG